MFLLKSFSQKRPEMTQESVKAAVPMSDELEGDFFSRKLAMSSMTRHMANWKRRQFTLRKRLGELVMSSKSGNSYISQTISFMSPFVHLGNHSYCPGRKHVIYIKYPDEGTGTPHELLVDFVEEGALNVWLEALTACRRLWMDMLRKETDRIGGCLGRFLNEQTLLHEIHSKNKDENGEAFATLYSQEKLQINTDTVEEEDMSGFAEAIEDSPPSSPLPITSPPLTTSASTPQVIIEEAAGGGSSRASVTIQLEKLRFQPPKMNILFMVVGTKGDVQPVLELALTMKAHGHTIRFATHKSFKKDVEEWVGCGGDGKLEFFEIAGDPHKLSEYMVKNGGSILPLSPEMVKETPKMHKMLVEILNTCWDACIAPWKTPTVDGANVPFSPDVIISNPVTNAHIHCAEALGIPLVLMFPQPWVPTKAFPHPLACMSYEKGWNMENYLSFQVIDRLLWLSLERDINEMRVKRMGLEELRVGDGGWNRINSCKVPFVKMWSPSLLPKPKDWDNHIEVVGNFFPRLSAHKIKTSDPSSTPLSPLSPLSSPAPSFTPPPGLLKFLELDQEKPRTKKMIVVGFGSMVVPSPAAPFFLLFLKAAALLNIKILIQLGWTKLDEGGGSEEEVFRKLADEAEKYAKGVADADLVYPDDDTKGEVGEAWEEVSNDGVGTRALVDGDDKPGDGGIWRADQDAYRCPPCPHDWLFPLMDGVVHHGGAGTVHTSLKSKVPTWVIPFFGDQPMWGQRTEELGCGPAPIPLSSLTFDIVHHRLQKLVNDNEMRARCQKIGRRLETEDALRGAVSFVYKHLPWQTMLCDVSVHNALTEGKEQGGEVELAQVFCPVCRLKMSLASYISLHHPSYQHSSHNLSHLPPGEHLPLPLVYSTYPLSPLANPLDGMVRGMGGYLHETIGGVRDLWGGVGGGVAGVIGGVAGLLKRQVVGGGLLLGGVVEGWTVTGGVGKGGMSPTPDTPLSPPPQGKVWDIRTQRAWGRGGMAHVQIGRCVVVKERGRGMLKEQARQVVRTGKLDALGNGKGGEMYRSFFNQREKMSISNFMTPWVEEEMGSKGGELFMSNFGEGMMKAGGGGRSCFAGGGAASSFPAALLAGNTPTAKPTAPLASVIPFHNFLSSFLRASDSMRVFRKFGGDGVSPLSEERYVDIVFQALAREELLATPPTTADSPYSFPSASQVCDAHPAPSPPEALTVSAALHLLGQTEGIAIAADDEESAGDKNEEEGTAGDDVETAGLSFLGFSILLHVSKSLK